MQDTQEEGAVNAFSRFNITRRINLATVYDKYRRG